MNTGTTQSDLDRPRLAPLPTPQRTSYGAEQKSLSHNDYTVGWVCALPLELGAAIAMLDEQHEMLPISPRDNNTYTLGTIDHHNIVLVCLPSYGTAKAATVASHMLRSFPNIQAGLMVGIGGGVPTSDLRLGDIVVGDSVVQYDLGKTVRDGKFERTGGSGKSPPDNLKMAVQSLRGRHNLQPSQIPDILSEMLGRHPSTRERYARPSLALDRLFDATYDHVEGPNDRYATSCDHCDISRLVQRLARPDKHCKIHYGKIASGNQVIKHGKTRDRLAHELGAICFEMEAAGLVDANFPCLTIRGISDYADSHKNNQWQGYAAAAAAAYAKELLAILPDPKSKDVSSTGMLWQSSRCLPNSGVDFSGPLLQSIANNEAKLKAVLSGERALTRSDMLKELRATQLTLSEFLQVAMHNLPAEKTSPCAAVPGHLSDATSEELGMGKPLSPEGSGTSPVGPESPRKGFGDIKTAQSQLSSAMETLERLRSSIQVSTEDMKAASRSFHHGAARMALKIRRAERLFLRTRYPILSEAEFERRARLAHSTASTDSSIATSLASGLRKLNRGDQTEAEDDSPVSKRAFEFKFEAPVPPLTNSPPASLDLVPMKGEVEGSSVVNPQSAVPTGLVEHRRGFQSENGIEESMRNMRRLWGGLFTSCGLSCRTTSATSSDFNFVQEESFTNHCFCQMTSPRIPRRKYIITDLIMVSFKIWLYSTLGPILLVIC